MGGIPTNNDAEVLSDNSTVVPGLYAAGECACVSVHGSNRLGTNSLLDINVFGKRAGRNAVEYVKTADFTPLPEDPAADIRACSTQLRDSNGTERIAAIRKELQDEMDKNAQVFRTDESLEHVTERHRRAARSLPEHRRARQGQALQHRPARGRRARLPPRPRRGRRLLGPQPQGEPRRAHARRLPQPRRRELHAAHDGLPVGRCRTHRMPPTTSGSTGNRSPITRYQPMERKY